MELFSVFLFLIVCHLYAVLLLLWPLVRIQSNVLIFICVCHRAGFSTSVQTGPGSHPAFCTMGTGSFPVLKCPECVVNHPLPFGVEVKETVELHLYYPCGTSQPVLGQILPLLFSFISFSSSSSSSILMSSYPVFRKSSLLFFLSNSDDKLLAQDTLLCIVRFGKSAFISVDGS